MVDMLDKTMRRHAPGDKFNKKVRHVLEQVPVVGFQLHKIKPKKGPRRCPELVPFPSCLRACMEYLDDDMGHTVITAHNKQWRLDNCYVFLMGVTGTAFRLSWKPGWEADNSVIGHMSDDPEEPFHRGLKAAGYKYEIIYPNDHDEAYFRKQIMESVRNKNCPVIARGVVGPPEECIITGFDENADVLIGRSFFQSIRDFSKDVQLEGNGYFRKRNWFKDTHCLILLHGKKQPRSLEKIYRDSLQWALNVMNNPRTQADRYCGIAAYDKLVETILDDNEFTNKKVKELHQRYIVLQDALSPLGEGRWYGGHFLNRIANDIDCPKAELHKAAVCLDDEHSFMWEMWKLVGGPGMSVQKAKIFADRKVREQTVKILAKSRQRYQTAANHIKRALELW